MIKPLSVFFCAVTFVLSCNNPEDGTAVQTNNASIPKTLSDSLYKAAMDGHDVGMAKMGTIVRYQQLIKQKSDSLKALKGKAELQQTLDSALKALNHAGEEMNRWMQEFDPDKAGETEQEKESYFRLEKEKIDSVNNKIFSSIESAKQIVE